MVPGLEVQFDTNDLLYVYLDRRRRRRKFLATTFLRVLGYPTDRDIVSHFYSPEALPLSEAMDEGELGHKVPFEDILDGELVVAKAYEPLTIGIVRQLLALGHKKVEVIDGREDEILLKSLRKDPAKDEESALKDIYRKLRPGDPPTAANSRALLKRLFFDPKKYDLTRVGRYKINQKLGIQVDSDQRIMVPEDFLAAVRYILKLKKGDGVIDDIDHLGSRRVRAVGELLANQCRVGLARTERLVKERMTLFDVNIEGMTPQKLINPKALSAVVRDFFGRSPALAVHGPNEPARRAHPQAPSFGARAWWSQSRPRRLRSPRRASVPLRPDLPDRNSGRSEHRSDQLDCAPMHASMSFGFIETPYRKVKNGKVTNEIEYLTADQEENFLIAQANKSDRQKAAPFRT